MAGARHPTRRQLLGRILLAGSAVGISIGAPPAVAAAGPPTLESDSALLSTMLGIELLAEFVLQRVLVTGLLPGPADLVARIILEHEQTHAALLSAELLRRGGARPSAPATTSVADQLLAGFHVAETVAGLGHAQDALKLLLDLEAVSERVYYRAMSKLTDPQLLRTAAEIMANEAQHYTAVGQLQHPHDFSRSVPDPFVEGA